MATLEIEGTSADLEELARDLNEALNEDDVEEIRERAGAEPGGAGEATVVMIAIEFGVAITMEVAKRVGKVVRRWLDRREGPKKPKIVFYADDGRAVEVTLDDLQIILDGLAGAR